MKNWWVVALGIVLGLLSAGVILLASGPPRGKVITLLPPPSPIPIQVHVSGAVQNPGVYALPPDSRVQDVIEVAGGFTIDADRSALNLAAHLKDGDRVDVPFQIQMITSTPTEPNTFTDETAPTQPTSLPSESQTQKININIADQSQLETLSGIGPVTAQMIITFREENGPFSSIVEIQKVSGIGPAKFEKIKEYITVDEQP